MLKSEFEVLRGRVAMRKQDHCIPRTIGVARKETQRTSPCSTQVLQNRPSRPILLRCVDSEVFKRIRAPRCWSGRGNEMIPFLRYWRAKAAIMGETTNKT